MALPPFSTAISAQDTITDTIKTTTGYFTDGDGTLSGTDIFTGSLSLTNEKYYFNVNHKTPTDSTSETQFSVTFAHIAGSGSDQYGDTTDDPSNLMGETQAIYKQFTNLLLEETEASDGFKISQQGSAGAIASDVRDDYIYVLIGKRDKYKDRINKKNWTLVLSGSNSTGSGVTLSLTDDSSTTATTATPAGPRYNIVSGALGSVYTSSAYKTYGWFYPDRGVMLFSGAELSASIPGGPNYGKSLTGVISASNGGNVFSGSNCTFVTDGVTTGAMIQITSASYSQRIQVSGSVGETFFTGSTNWAGNTWTGSSGTLGIATTNITASFSTDSNVIESSSGFAPNINAQGNPKNALRFVNCLRNGGSENVFTLRSEEDATEENYFCRIKAMDYNFTANPTFVSGGLNKLRHITMTGNPTTFITGVGLYNSAGQLLATAQLSKPLKKNFISETTIKVQLTY
jgi:hypothetical protein